jgi:hypothetical protein
MIPSLGLTNEAALTGWLRQIAVFGAVPNSKITTGTLVNYNLPERREVAEVAILEGHGVEPARVCRIAVEEASRTACVLPDQELIHANRC